jgi:hypothetical protein
VVRFKYGIVTLAIVGGLVALIVLPFWLVSRLTSSSWTYDMYIENHLDEQVALRVWTTEKTNGFDAVNSITVPPCFMRSFAKAGPPDRLDLAVQGAQKQIRDLEYTMGEVENYTLQVSVWIPSRKPCECPEPIEGQYVLHIDNITAEDLPIVYQGQEIGVATRGTATEFGPFDGEWRDVSVSDVDIPDGEGGYRTGAEGDVTRRVMPVEFPLGQTPVITISIRSAMD